MEKREDFLIPDEIVEWIGLKKSEYLSRLIQEQSSDDISVEEFHLFDHFVPSTIEKPDRTYQITEDNQLIRTYIKTYSENAGFHQIVIGVLLDDSGTNSNVFVPIIYFVSRKNQLVLEFSKGEVIGSKIFS